MLPAVDCSGFAGEVCCTSLYDIANYILAGAYQALIECYPTGFCASAPVAYVTIGNGDDLVFDALTVALGEVKVSPGSVKNGIRQSPMSSYTAEYIVRLVESGWPTVHEEQGEIVFPDPVEQHALARHSYSHGERIYRRLAYMATHGDVADVTGCTAAMVTSLLPINPLGGVVGWRTSVVLTMPGGF